MLSFMSYGLRVELTITLYRKRYREGGEHYRCMYRRKSTRTQLSSLQRQKQTTQSCSSKHNHVLHTEEQK